MLLLYKYVHPAGDVKWINIYMDLYEYAMQNIFNIVVFHFVDINSNWHYVPFCESTGGCARSIYFGLR